MTIDMDDLMDAIVAADSPSKVSDAIKDMLYAKTAEKVDSLKPEMAASLFGQQDEIEVEEPEVNDEPVATTEGEDQE